MTHHRSRPLARRAPAAAALGLVALVLAGCGTSGDGTAAASQAPGAGTGSTACPTSQPAPLAAGETRTVVIKTSKGDITLKIEGSLSPIAAGNFVALVACGYYDGVVFHRVVPGFVIQGGDPTGTGNGGPGYSIQDEPVTATYHRGTLAMARSSQPNSQGSQFFIVLADGAAQALASYNTYAIFGEVTAGMEAADAITAAADQEIPTNPIVMDSVTVTNP
ncbi:MAG: peptidylprolyl isomerase [Chloroflexota bacterium]